MNSRFASALIFLFVGWRADAQAPRSESGVVMTALNALRDFQRLWEREWTMGLGVQRAEMNRLPPGTRIMGNATILVEPRLLELSCYFGTDEPPNYRPDHAWGTSVKRRAIESKTNAEFWACPNWRPPADYYVSQAQMGDESISIDNALIPAAQMRVRMARETLVRDLAAAVRRTPRDSVLVGQYVRMLVDNRQMAIALTFLDNCQARASWCLALRGYVSHRMGQHFDAEDAFLAMLDSLSAGERCIWSDIHLLFDDDDQKAYRKADCARQDSLNRTTWWLADPLWSVAGNDRLSEQFSRRVIIALHSALGHDERYNWTPSGGGDALAELVQRYGWQSYAYSAGHLLRFRRPSLYASQKVHDKYRAESQMGGLRSTHEYALGRIHVIPPMRMIERPFDISSNDWSMNAPGGDLDASFEWWPVEHYAPQGELVKLVDQQTGFLRRQTETLIAYATNLARTDLSRRLGDTVDAVILDSPGPETIRRIGEARVGAQDRLTFLAPLFAGPSLVSVEVPWTLKGERGGRVRFGVTPPPPLSVMTASDVAISDPIILAVPANADALPNFADSAVALMLGSTALGAGTRSLGVYWETYGISQRDSVEITVAVQRRGGGSAVTASWREPQPGRLVRNVAGDVPIQMRSVIIDAGALAIGTYTLEIAVRKGDDISVRSSREFTIR